LSNEFSILSNLGIECLYILSFEFSLFLPFGYDLVVGGYHVIFFSCPSFSLVLVLFFGGLICVDEYFDFFFLDVVNVFYFGKVVGKRGV